MSFRVTFPAGFPGEVEKSEEMCHFLLFLGKGEKGRNVTFCSFSEKGESQESVGHAGQGLWMWDREHAGIDVEHTEGCQHRC